LHGVILLVLLAGAAALLAARPAIPQHPSYHGFVDARPLGPVPNAWNVLSNLPFVLTGGYGLTLLLRRGAQSQPPLEAWERMAFATLLGGIILVAFGSAYYHAAPSNPTLLWDRLPMSVAFMGLTALVLGDRVSERAGRILLAPLLTAGLASVLYWSASEASGRGDLRPYVLVQGFPILAIPLLLATAKGRAPGGAWLLACVLAYGAAKAAEHWDAAVYDATAQAISGHALKHLLAGVGTGFIALWLRARLVGAPDRPTATTPRSEPPADSLRARA